MFDGHLVAFRFRCQLLGLGAEFFSPGSREKPHGLLLFGGRLALCLLAAGHRIQPRLLGGDDLDPWLQIRGVRTDVVGIDAMPGEDFMPDLFLGGFQRGRVVVLLAFGCALSHHCSFSTGARTACATLRSAASRVWASCTA